MSIMWASSKDPEEATYMKVTMVTRIRGVRVVNSGEFNDTRYTHTFEVRAADIPILRYGYTSKAEAVERQQSLIKMVNEWYDEEKLAKFRR